MINKIKIHHTHKQRIRSLFRDGFSEEELAIMYKVQWPSIKEIIKGLQKPEQV